MSKGLWIGLAVLMVLGVVFGITRPKPIVAATGNIVLRKIEGCAGGNILKVTAINNTSQDLAKFKVDLILGAGKDLRSQSIEEKDWKIQEERVFSVKRPNIKEADACLARFANLSDLTTAQPIQAIFRPKSNQQ
jgi:hypothetical protein